MRRLLVASLAGSLCGMPLAFSAAAEEALFLRIRPLSAPIDDEGSAGSSFDREEARQALARREEVWNRAERRARIAIASVCSGCLKAPASRPPMGERAGIAESDASKIVESEPPAPSSSPNQLHADNR